MAGNNNFGFSAGGIRDLTTRELERLMDTARVVEAHATADAIWREIERRRIAPNPHLTLQRGVLIGAPGELPSVLPATASITVRIPDGWDPFADHFNRI